MGKVIERLRNDARIRLIRTAWPAVRRAASGMLRLVVGTPRLAIARFQVSRQNWDGVIRTWDVPSGRLLSTQRGHVGLPPVVHVHATGLHQAPRLALKFLDPVFTAPLATLPAAVDLGLDYATTDSTRETRGGGGVVVGHAGDTAEDFGEVDGLNGDAVGFEDLFATVPGNVVKAVQRHDALHDLVGTDAVRQRFVGEHKTMAEDVGDEVGDVFGQHVLFQHRSQPG